MEALISGQAGRAVFIEGNSVSVVEVYETEQEIKVSHNSIPYLLAGATDILEFKFISRKESHTRVEFGMEERPCFTSGLDFD